MLPPSSFRPSAARRVALAGALLLPALLASCGTVDKVDAADQQIRVDPVTPVAFDIENFHGSVRIVVDPSLSEVRPVIKKHVSWWTEHGIREDAQTAINVRSRTVSQDGRSVITIKTSTKWPEPEKVWVDLTLFVPRCDGVRVWNRGGKVLLEGVAGAIHVENAEFADNEAPIEVRTDRDLTDPVVLSTTSGSVVYQVGPGSAGRFTLDSADSTEMFDCKVVSPTDLRSDGKTTTATLNAGDNPVLLKSGSGSVIVLVINNPMDYTNKTR
jgi:hypothetical protein